MTEAQTLAEQYSLKEKEEKADAVTEPGEVKNVDNPGNAAPEEVVSKKAEQTSSAVAEEVAKVADAPPEGSEPTPADNDENIEANPSATENSNEAATENTSENAENSDDRAVAEETPEIKLETAPVDFRFPTTNQSRHCFTRYIEYHRCIAAKGEGAPECDRFAKYYRALCPGEWVERWNEQRENGTFPGPM